MIGLCTGTMKTQTEVSYPACGSESPLHKNAFFSPCLQAKKSVNMAKQTKTKTKNAGSQRAFPTCK